MKKQLSLVLIILLSNLCIAQKHVTTYYDYAKIHPKEDYYVNTAGQKNGPYKGYNSNGVVVMEYNYLNGNPNGLCIDYNADTHNQRSVAGKVTYKNGVKDGYALAFDPDNHFWTKWKEGTYKDGKENGLWKEWWPVDGVQPVVLKSEGYYLNGVTSGLWTNYHKNGKIQATGNTSNNLLTGTWRFYSETGNLIAKGGYLEGRKNGSWYYYDVNDSTKVRNSGEYANGIRIGAWTIYFDKKWNETDEPSQYAFYRKITFDNSGKPTADKVCDFYISGAKQWEGYLSSINPEVYRNTGVAIYYYENGKVQQEYDYDKGIIKTYYDNGTLSDETGMLKDGTLTGSHKEYYENGKLKAEGSYINKTPDGYWKFYYENGVLSSEGKYDKKGMRDNKTGIWKTYYESGKIKSVTDYRNPGTGYHDPSVTEYDERGKITKHQDAY